LSLSSPGGPGLTADYTLFGPIAVSGRLLGTFVMVARGAGVSVTLLRADAVRLYATGFVGEIRCVADPDAAACGNATTGASRAWQAGGGAEFAISADHRWTFGIEVGYWFAQNGPTLDTGEQESRVIVAGLLRRYFD
jgi:hypothetical protein